MARNPITIEVLETLDAIDRRGSFAKAAEELNKATSAISYAVQKLEEQLDISLFQRQGRRSVLTPAGRLILAEGREILQTTMRLANKAKEIATGWEPRINIAVESHQSYSLIFSVLKEFLRQHPKVEIDVCESVLYGGWEALEGDKVDLIVGSPGPVPMQKGYRAILLAPADLVPVIASTHELASVATKPEALQRHFSKVRRVITHDTTISGVTRSAGLSSDGAKFYVQNIDQKVEAILAGVGVGHLPRHRIQQQLDDGKLILLDANDLSEHDNFLAWKISNKGKGLQVLTQRLSKVFS
jgi:DNA-binding transcriptional LysR family regulator